MPITMARARKLCTKSELPLFEASLPRNVTKITPGRIKQKIKRARTLRNKYRQLAQRHLGGQHLVLEVGPREDLPRRIAISSSTMALLTGIGTIIAGLLAAFSSTLLFSVSIAVLSTAVLITWFFVDEPRHRIVSLEG